MSTSLKRSRTRSKDKADAADAAGLKVMWNSNADNLAKWYAVTNPGTKTAPQNPTHMFGALITAQQYQDFKTNLCMTSAGVAMPDTKIFDKGPDGISGTSDDRWKYRVASISDNTIIFATNYYAPQAIAGNAQANVTLMMSHGQVGSRPYSGLFIDEVNFPGNAPPTCHNPINHGNIGGTSTAYDGGRKLFIKALRDRVSAVYGYTTKVSGNPWNASQYSPEQAEPAIALDFIYSESGGGQHAFTLAEIENGSRWGAGTQDTRTWGVVPIDRVAVQLPGHRGFDSSYRAGQLVAGRIAWQGGWFGWYGEPDLAETSNAVMLMKAIPNWDNRVGVPTTQRSWNEVTDVYHSPNSHIDNGVTYGRRWTDGKLFVVWNNKAAPVILRPGETVNGVKCVNSMFLETTDCMSHIAVTGTTFKSIILNSATHQLAGYVIPLS